jgi:hypothetical protein
MRVARQLSKALYNASTPSGQEAWSAALENRQPAHRSSECCGHFDGLIQRAVGAAIDPQSFLRFLSRLTTARTLASF